MATQEQVQGQVPSHVGLNNAGMGATLTPNANPAEVPQAQPMPAIDAKQIKAKNAADQSQAVIGEIADAGTPKAEEEDPGFLNKLKLLESMGAGGGEEAAPTNPNTPFLEHIKNRILEQYKQSKAEFRSGVSRNPKEQQTGLEKVYGPENVKVLNKEVWVKPDSEKGWKKFNESEFKKTGDAFILDTLSALNISPEEIAAKIPGMVGQGISSAAGAAAGFVAGGMPGAVAGGFGGGVAGSKLSKEADQKINEMLHQADPDFKYENKLDSIANIMQNDYVQGLFGAVGGAFYAHAAKRSAEVVALLHKGLSEPEIKQIQSLSAKDTNFGKFVSSLKEFKEHFFPIEETEGMKKGLKISEDAMGAAKANVDAVGKQIGVIDDEISGLQEATGSYLRPTEFQASVREQLEQHGVKFKPDGKVKYAKDADGPGTRLSVTTPDGAQKLMNMNDEMVDLINSSEAGLPVKRTNSFLDTLQQNIQEQVKMGRSDSSLMFTKARGALGADKVSHYNELLGGKDTPAAKHFAGVMAEYSKKNEAIKSVLSLINTDAKIAKTAQIISKNGSAQSAEAMTNFRTILGSESKEWNNLRGEVLGRIIDKSAFAGELRAKTMLDFISNTDNKDLMKILFNGDKQQLNLFTMIMSEGKGLQNAQVLTSKAKAVVDLAVDVFGKWIPGKNYMRTISQFTNNNKASIDYFAESLLKNINKAVGTEQRAVMLEQYAMLNELKSSSQVVHTPMVKTKLAEGSRLEAVRRYKPFRQTSEGLTQAGPASGSSIPPMRNIGSRPEDQDQPVNQ